jgi:hypothetical protein
MTLFRIPGKPMALVLALVALALPVASGPTAANAAMATSYTLTTANRPDLTGATITGQTRVRFCFDKVLGIGGALNPASFVLGDYHQDGFGAGAGLAGSTIASATNNKCVDVGFGLNGNEPDLPSYTYAHVTAGQVQGGSGANGALNLADSVPLIGSTSHSGTRGLTAGVDLQSVQVNSGGTTNTIEYTFDQIVSDQVPLDATAFFFEDGNGDKHLGFAILGVNGGKVTVGFGNPVIPCNGPAPNAGCNDVASAVRAGTSDASASPGRASNDWTCTNPPFISCGPLSAAPAPRAIGSSQVVRVPGTGGLTSVPDVTAASVVGRTMLVTYDQAVAPGASSNCLAIAADGSRIQAVAPGILAGGGNQLVISFSSDPDSSHFPSEQMVAFLDSGGCALVPPGTPGVGAASATGSAVTGGNVGANSLGYTTGPEALSLSLDRAGDTATVVLDQPVSSVDPSRFHLVLGGNGNNAAAPSSASVSTSTPDAFARGVVRLTFAAGEVPDNGAVGIRMDAGAALTFPAAGGAGTGLTEQANIEQVFAAS